MTDIKSRLEASPYSPEVTVLDTGYLVNQTDGDISVLSELTLMPCGKFELRDTLGCGEKVSIDPAGTGYNSIEAYMETTFG